MSFAPAAAAATARWPPLLKGEVSHPRKVKFLGLAFSLPHPLLLLLALRPLLRPLLLHPFPRFATPP